jgi:hypothetical protein
VPAVGTLAVELRRIVDDREEDLQQRPVAHLLRVVRDLHRFGVAGEAAADHLVHRGLLGTAGIARDRLRHALHALEDALDAPEAAAGEHRGLHPGRGGRRIDRGRRDLHRRLAGVRRDRNEAAGDERGGERREQPRAARRGERKEASIDHGRLRRMPLGLRRPAIITERARRCSDGRPIPRQPTGRAVPR